MTKNAKDLLKIQEIMFDNEGHYIDDPLDVVNAEPDFSGIGEPPKLRFGDFFASVHSTLINKHSKAVFADFDKMVTHLARTHHLHEDEIGILLGAWFNEQPGCLRVNIRQKQLTKEQLNKLREAARNFIVCVVWGFDTNIDEEPTFTEELQKELIEPFIEPLINGRL